MYIRIIVYNILTMLVLDIDGMLELDYKNYISLGYFCNVASDLEELGLRNSSSPFDWNISIFEGVIKALNNEFANFMDYNTLVQSEKYRQHYCDPNYKIWFFHDFNKYQPLIKQYDAVKAKYDRRIDRFLNNITKPTLFFRYVCNEPGFINESKWIEQNQSFINDVVKSFNSKNKIIYIGDEDTNLHNIEIFNVNKDKGDVVSRHPIINNIKLRKIVEQENISGKKYNIERFRKKEAYKHSLRHNIFNKFHTHALAIKNGGVYNHTKSFYWPDK